MLEWVEATRGERCPKQFCTFVGSRSMLEHTLDRAHRIVAPPQIVTVITRGQAHHLARALRGGLPGRLVEQPADRGTAAGVMLGLTLVAATDPEAVVLVLPAGHFIRPEAVFVRYARLACRLAHEPRDRLVVLGAAPDGPETDYGWILHGPSRGPSFAGFADERPRQVTRFREKPGAAEAARLYDAGALWNTLVVAGTVSAMWSVAVRHTPEASARFSVLLDLLRLPRGAGATDTAERLALPWRYGPMQPVDFSRDILQAAADSTVVVPMRGLEWSDWGRPERVQNTLGRIGSPLARTLPHATSPSVRRATHAARESRTTDSAAG
jgi:mannose-1-phosphate guanylyltransferase